MAIYHLSVKPVQRSGGRSAVAAIAYRTAEKHMDHRTGLEHDFTRKQSVDHTEIVGFDGDRNDLWNKAELAEKRKDATTAREYEVALPRELNDKQKIQLVRDYSQWLHKRHGVAVDFAIHDSKGENPHAHIMTTTRQSLGDQLGDKVAREWSDTKRKKEGLAPRADDLKEARQEWEKSANYALKLAGQEQRIDHRSYKDRGLEGIPTKKLGPAAHAMEKRGIATERGDKNRLIQGLNQGYQWARDKVQSLGQGMKDRYQQLVDAANSLTEQDAQALELGRAEKALAEHRQRRTLYDDLMRAKEPVPEKPKEKPKQKAVEKQQIRPRRDRDRGMSM